MALLFTLFANRYANASRMHRIHRQWEAFIIKGHRLEAAKHKNYKGVAYTACLAVLSNTSVYIKTHQTDLMKRKMLYS